MTPEQFCFWLHGFFELTGEDSVTEDQAKMIREHLDLVFTKVTPPLEKSKKKSGRGLLQEVLDEAKQEPTYQLPPPRSPTRIC